MSTLDSKWFVIDCTGSDTHKYADYDGNLVNLRENAARFDTEEAAEVFAREIDPENRWASVEQGEWC